MDMIRILAISGSLRKDSFNRQLALAAREALGSSAELTLLEFADVPMMNEDIEVPAPDAVKRVRETVKAADGVWFFTPEYNHFFPGVLKNLIDWLSRPVSDGEPQVLAHKPAAISGITSGMSGTGLAQDHLVTLISYLNMDVMNAPRLKVPNAYTQADENDKLTLTVSTKFLNKQAEAFVAFIRSRRGH